MTVVDIKLDLIKKLIERINSEYQIVEYLLHIGSEPCQNSNDYYFENLYFNLIKYIIDQNDLPTNVCKIIIYVNDDDMISKCEFISCKIISNNDELDVELIFNE